MQRHIIEVTESIEVQCLPDVLRRAGYRTAFFQSALGRFEDRPRLVALLGYEEFAAWEEIRGEPLGYLASDDESMVPVVARWLDSSEGDEPFFATVLTSAAHHPYQLPRRIPGARRPGGQLRRDPRGALRAPGRGAGRAARRPPCSVAGAGPGGEHHRRRCGGSW